MIDDVGSATAAALGIAVSPVGLVLAVALLGTGRPIRNAGAFVAGQAFTVTAIAALVVAIVSDEDGVSETYAAGVQVLELVVGCLLAAVAVQLARRHDAATSLSGALGRVGLRGAFLAGVGMIAANPKNLALTLAGATAISELAYSPGGRAAGVVAFAAAAVSSVGILVASAVVFPSRSAAVIRRAGSVVGPHERPLLAAALALLALYFVLQGTLGLLLG